MTAPIPTPEPGKAVLACRCGRVLDLADLYRYVPPRPVLSRVAIAQIVCSDCATADIRGRWAA